MRKELSPSLLIFLIILFSLSCTRSHKSIEEFPKPEAKLYGKTVVYVPESLAEQFVMVEKGEGESEKYDFGKDVVDVTRQVFQIYFYDVEIIIGESRKPDLLGTSQYFFEINGIVRCFNASPKRDYPKNYSYNPKSGQTSSSFSDHLLGAFFDSVIKDLPYAGPREYISRPPQPKPPTGVTISEEIKILVYKDGTSSGILNLPVRFSSSCYEDAYDTSLLNQSYSIPIYECYYKIMPEVIKYLSEVNNQ